MGRRKVSITIYLEPEQVRDLRVLSDSTRRPQASMIREAIQDYLDSRRSEIPPTAPDPCQTTLEEILSREFSHCHGAHCDGLDQCICLCGKCIQVKKADR